MRFSLPDRTPLQSPSRPPGRPPRGGPTLPRFWHPTTTSLELAPLRAASPTTAPVRSQVFSTSQRFPQQARARGLVSSRCRPGRLLQSFPLTGIARPSRGRSAPLRSSTRVEDATTGAVHRRFHRRPRSRAVAWILRRPWVRFPRGPKTPLPAHPGRRAPGPSPRPASPASKPCSPCESVHAGTGCPAPPVVALLAFGPPRACPPGPRHLDPPPGPRDPSATPPPVKEERPRPRGRTRPRPRQPPGPGEASRRRNAGSTSSAELRPGVGRPAPPLGGVPAPLTFPLRCEPQAGPPERRSIQGVNDLPKETANSYRVCRLLVDLATSKPRPDPGVSFDRSGQPPVSG